MCVRPLSLTLIVLVIPTIALSQTAATDSQTLKAILAELRQLRRDLQTTNAMAARAQIALYRLQRKNEAVVRAMPRVRNAGANATQLEDLRSHKAQEIERGRAEANHSETPKVQQEFEQVLLPAWTSDLERLQRQAQQARAEQAEAERQLRDEQTKLDRLNDSLERYNNALAQIGETSGPWGRLHE